MTKKYLNILFLNSTKVYAFGGIERWMINLGKGLREKGHNIYFAGKKGSIFLDICEEQSFPTFPTKFGMDYSIINGYRLSRILKRYNINVIINHYNKDVKLGYVAKTLIKKPIVNVARSGMPSVRNNIQYRLLYKRMVDCIITPSKSIKEKYMSYGWMENDFVRVIKNGVVTINTGKVNTAKIKNSLNIPIERKVVGSIGRLVPIKQFDLFLKVARMISDVVSDTHFLIVGEGPLKQKITQWATELNLSGKVTLTGFQKDPTPLYTICDLILLTSKYDGYPNVLLESMSAGKPVIAFDVGGISEFVKDGYNGYLVEPFDYKQMARISINLLKNQHHKEAIGNNARNYILNNHSVEEMVNITEALLLHLVNKKFQHKN